MKIKVRNKSGFVIAVLEDDELTVELIDRKVKGYTPLIFVRTEPTTEENGRLVLKSPENSLTK